MLSSCSLNLDRILPLVRKPGQYVGGELHAVDSGFDAGRLNFCLIFPDLYEIGMSHQGLQILYHLLNSREQTTAHRAYVPDIDMERELRAQGLPLFSLEAKAPLAAYDVLGVTLPYELCYSNILTVLNLAGLPFWSSERDEGHPLVLGGGSCAFNPEPAADFFDAIVLGDGEEIILEIADLLASAKKERWPRTVALERLARTQGVYVPSLFKPKYVQDRLVGVEPLLPDVPFVRRRVLARLHAPSILYHPLVPVVKPVHDRLGVEIARGCTRGCRFCQAGITYRPVRERTLEEIMDLASQGIAHSGFEELALLSLSTGDFSCLGELMTALMDHFADDFVSVSMPSMRVGTLTPEIMEQIKRVRKTGFTIAPEAGTDSLRQVIKKGITEEGMLATCREAFALGRKLINN
ncbi:MAG: radical SAM protein [Desulfobulbus sp.]|nr:radical SAM protein [Desulfobulbus sp.]